MVNRSIVQSNGVELCAETSGDPADPAILLIHGAAASLMAWDDAVVQGLVNGGRFVIRYDHRDTGQSVSYAPGAPPYGLHDLTADAIGLLDAFDVERAHLVGISMGGGIAQIAAVAYPERIASLTLIATSPGGPDLPPPADAFLTHVSSGQSPDWSDREAVADHIISMLRVFAGEPGHFNEADMRAKITIELDRTANVAASQINHFAMQTGDPVRDRLGEISVPTLVMHGDMDPVFPLGHAQALQRDIPDARLLVLEQTGHTLHPATWDIAVPAILAHTA